MNRDRERVNANYYAYGQKPENNWKKVKKWPFSGFRKTMFHILTAMNDDAFSTIFQVEKKHRKLAESFDIEETKS